MDIFASPIVKQKIRTLLHSILAFLGGLNFFYFSWCLAIYYSSCGMDDRERQACSVVNDLTQNLQTSLVTYDYLLSYVICFVFFVRESIRYGEQPNGNVRINSWMYIAITLMFSVSTSLPLFTCDLIMIEDDIKKDHVQVKKGRKITFFFLFYLIICVIDAFLWIPELPTITPDIIHGDFANHYLNISSQSITRGLILLWIDISLLSTYKILVDQDQKNYSTHLQILFTIALVILTAFSASTALSLFLLIREYLHPHNYCNVNISKSK